MLSARKLHLAAGLKVHGLDLRKAELDFYILRYIAVTGISTIQTGLAYVAIIKVKIPEDQRPPHESWQVFVFYTCACLTMAFALFQTVICGFLVVNAQGLTLRGPPNSVARCVEILRRHWWMIKCSLGFSLVMLLATALAIAWMKLLDVPGYPWPAIGCSAIVFCVGTSGACKMYSIASDLSIDRSALVQGDLTIGQQQGAEGASSVDILSEQYEVIPVSRGGRGS